MKEIRVKLFLVLGILTVLVLPTGSPSYAGSVPVADAEFGGSLSAIIWNYGGSGTRLEQQTIIYEGSISLRDTYTWDIWRGYGLVNAAFNENLQLTGGGSPMVNISGSVTHVKTANFSSDIWSSTGIEINPHGTIIYYVQVDRNVDEAPYIPVPLLITASGSFGTSGVTHK